MRVIEFVTGTQPLINPAATPEFLPSSHTNLMAFSAT